MIALTLVVLSQAPSLPTLFTHRAAVELDRSNGSWVRLPLPEAVLKEVEPDLADLRLIDARGHLVPFSVQRTWPGLPQRTSRLTLISTRRLESPSASGTPNQFDETAVFELPASSAPFRRLEFATSTQTFVRAVRFEATSKTGAVLARGETTFFRLGPSDEQLTLPLPASASDATQLRVTLSGQGDGYLELAAYVTTPERAPTETTLSWPIEAKPVREGNTTLIRINKPVGVVPVRLRLETTTPWFDRRVRVTERLESVGEGRVFRLAGSPRVERTEIRLRSISSETLEVRIDDLDSPPLEQLRLSFVIEQPELIAALPIAEPVTLYFGGHRTRRAQFDTSNFVSTEISAASIQPSRLMTFELNPEAVAAAPFSEFRRAGAPLDRSRFPHQSAVAVTSEAPVTTIEFEAEHVATMAAGFRDLRLVDRDGRQRPFVLRTSSVTYEVASTETNRPGETVLAFHMPGTFERLSLRAPARAPYFSRYATLKRLDEGKKPVELWRGWLTYNPGRHGVDTSLDLAVSGTAGAYAIELTDQHDAAIEGLSVWSTLEVPTLLALLEPGDYVATWGDFKQQPAAYDLARVASVIDELHRATVKAGPPGTNASYVEAGYIERTGGATRWIFWSVILLAVAILGGMVVKIARAAPSDEAAPKS